MSSTLAGMRLADSGLTGLPAAEQDPGAVAGRLRRRAVARARRPVTALLGLLAAAALWPTLTTTAASPPTGRGSPAPTVAEPAAGPSVPPGLVVVAVVPAEPATLSMVRTGDLVDLYGSSPWEAAPGSAAALLAGRARVVGVSPAPGRAAAGQGLEAAQLAGPAPSGALLVAVPDEDARRLAGAVDLLVSVALLTDD